jgi:hypothetical protein
MESLLAYGPAPFMIIGAFAPIFVGALVLLISTYLDMARVKNDYAELLGYLGDGESRNLFREMNSMIKKIEADNMMTERDIAHLYSLIDVCVQKVAVVRYNAFHNVGSDQSYSVALLDSLDDGVVFSGIFGRDSSTTYAKPIQSGFSDYILTEEEENAIALARRRFAASDYYGHNPY